MMGDDPGSDAAAPDAKGWHEPTLDDALAELGEQLDRADRAARARGAAAPTDQPWGGGVR